MKMQSNIWKSGLVAGLMLVAAPGVYAAGADTNAGTLVTNTVDVDYQVNSEPQDTVSASATFLVDRKINVTVVSNGDITVLPGATQQALKFTVTNLSNNDIADPVRFNLVADNFVATPADDFDTGAYTIYRDNASPGTFDPLVDTVAVTSLDMAEDAAIVVWVVSDIPGAGNADGDTSDVSLTATVDAGLFPNHSGVADVAGTVQNVYADGDADAGAVDAQYNGSYFDVGTYTLETAQLDVAKSSTVVSDPFSSSNPKRIPGAIVQYCIDVSNNGAVTATAVQLTDALPAEVQAPSPGNNLAAMNVEISSDATTNDCTTGNWAAHGGAASFTAPNLTVDSPDLAPTERFSVRFDVEVK